MAVHRMVDGEHLTFRLRAREGFTLIELMIVVVITGILASIAIPRFALASHKVKEKEADVTLKQVYTMQEAHRAAHGSYAADAADLVAIGLQIPSQSQLQYYQALTVGATCAHMTKNADAAYNDRKLVYSTGDIVDGTC
jgi:prepilin-type N-terminal cleavage/methylation domain-containing protein